MDTTSIDPAALQELLGGNSNATSQPLIDLSMFYPFMIAFTIVSILITILYLINIIQHWRVNRAILEIRDILKKMNTSPAPVQSTPQPDTTPKDTQ